MRRSAVRVVLASVGVLLALLAGGAPARSDPAELSGDITFSVASGAFTGSLSVGLGTEVPDTEIRYTTDGRAPDATSPLYAGEPVRITRTTQVRARLFADGGPVGRSGSALYVSTSVTTSHDVPVVVVDVHGAGRPGTEEYLDAAVMTFEPGAPGGTS